MSNPVYITAVGAFLPGEPVDNDRAARLLGPVDGRQDSLRRAALRRNGIRHRHYALDDDGVPTHTNAELAAAACRNALGQGELNADAVELIAAASSQGDLLAPGFASMVHAELGIGPTELASFQSFCASGIMALKAAYAGVKSGEKRNGLVCASEFASRFFRAGYLAGAEPSADTEFLRWTLSDGAGAALVENRPNRHGQSLRIEFIDLVSYANSFETCMYGGGVAAANRMMGPAWSSYPTLAAAVSGGAFHLRQDFELLENMVPLGLKRYMELIEAGRIDPDAIDWCLYHFSSDHLRRDLLDRAGLIGAPINGDRIFTNLYEKGNTGSAAIYIMLDELLKTGRLRDGEKILCMVPESGRFIVSYVLLTVVGEPSAPLSAVPPPLAVETHDDTANGDDLRQSLLRRLATVWIDFEKDLNAVPFIDKLNRGRLRIEDYRALLLNLRQQVVEGARWIARAASNVTVENFDIRSRFLHHAEEEHRDFRMLEADFVACGGRHEDILNAEKNIGSEALSAWMFFKAGRENPIDLIGAMFIIEGLGQRLAEKWGRAIRDQLELSDDQVSFLLYHGSNDDNHIEHMWAVFDWLELTPQMADAIVKTAKVTARLYRLQLEELGNI